MTRRSPAPSAVGRIAGRGALFAAFVVALLPVGAQADTSRSSVTMFSDAGDYIGGGQQRLFDSDTARVSVSGTATYLTVNVSGGTRGDSYAMDFAAPSGQALGPGVYDGAQRASFRAATRPGIDIFGDGRGCNQDTGRFEVRDLAVGPNGVPTRLWIVYEQHCEGSAAALFGEVRVGEPAAGAGLVEPTVTRWPPGDLGETATAVPVTVVATGPAVISAVSMGGVNPGDFPIRVDECSGQRLAAGAVCQVWVRFVPSDVGARSAILRATLADGTREAAVLQGFAYGGRTRVVLHSEPGDYIGDGLDYSYTPANAAINATSPGLRGHVAFSINGGDASRWTADFAAAGGDILAPGRYDATRYPFNGSGPGLDVGGNGRGCNTLTGNFTVTDAAFSSDGSVKSFGASFEQHCDGNTPTFTGLFEFRAGDTTSPAPWMTTGPLTPLPSDDGPGPGGGLGGGGGGGQPGGGGGGGQPGGAGGGPAAPTPLGVANPSRSPVTVVPVRHTPSKVAGPDRSVKTLLLCHSSRRCRGVLVLRLFLKGNEAWVLGRARFSIPAHGRRSVRVNLSTAARRLRNRWPRASLAARVRSASHGGGATVAAVPTLP